MDTVIHSTQRGNTDHKRRWDRSRRAALLDQCHFVDLERDKRRNGKLIASDIQEQIDTSRQVAYEAGLSDTCLDRIEKAERVGPKMQATIEFVSTYVCQQVRQLGLTPPASYAIHAHLIPSYDLERVASTKTIVEGQRLRALAERIRTSLFEPGRMLSELTPALRDRLQ